ncbi:MAG: hypothetical protein EZS28_042853 [Streblomastix strix]|uniref:Uncharacterized protein n=1 Tax=Streblomastix strix TaxID=222440 RepID=A0A5J4TVM6_9EUKA|nr:MAG: hypothetical protein EZS28_042853 [Streblomastix strix]
MGNNSNGCLQGRLKINAEDSLIREDNTMGIFENSQTHIIQLERVTSYSSNNEMIFKDFIKRTIERHQSADRQYCSYVKLEQMQSSSPPSRFSKQHSTVSGATGMKNRRATHTRDNEQRTRQFVQIRSIRGLCYQQRYPSYSIDETESGNNDVRIRHSYLLIAQKVLQYNYGQMADGERRLINQLGESNLITPSTHTPAFTHNQESQGRQFQCSNDHSTQLARPILVYRTSRDYSIDDQIRLERINTEPRLLDEEETMISHYRRNEHVSGFIQPGERLFRFLLEEYGLKREVVQRIVETWHGQWRRHVSALTIVVKYLEENNQQWKEL